MGYGSPAAEGRALLDIRVGKAGFVYRQLAAPWCYRVGRSRDAVLYAVTHGAAVVAVDGVAPLSLPAGSVISLVGGQPHRVADSDASLRYASEVHRVDDLALGGDAVVETLAPAQGEVRLLAAHVPLTSNPLPAILPPVIHVPADEQPTSARLQQVLALAVSMNGAPAGARGPLLKRVAEILAIELTEFALEQQDGSWRTRVADPRIQRTIGLMRVNPERPWTLAGLAEEASMSRSAFAARFRSVVGTPPLDYLRRCRMENAIGLLNDTDLPLYAVANRVGYRSESAFSRAFEKLTGISPGRYRRQVP